MYLEQLKFYKIDEKIILTTFSILDDFIEWSSSLSISNLMQTKPILVLDDFVEFQAPY